MEHLDLLEQLIQYTSSNAYPFHMPGHKRREIGQTDAVCGQFPSPYSVDITEIDGFDNLHHAEGILREAMDFAAKVYGAEKSYYLVNGSTCGILSAICGTTTCGGKILMARNSHLSAYHGVILNRLNPAYLYPEIVEEFGFNGVIRPEDVERALRKEREEMEKRETGKSAEEGDERTEGKAPAGEVGEAGIQAVFLVSPTYEGIVSDIQAISRIAHKYGVPLIVDEAHGAHLAFAGEQGYFPPSALDMGADIVIQSLHKTLPSFTQTAILHIKSQLVDYEKVERYLKMFQSSSPSYVLMAGIDRCIRYMDGAGRLAMGEYVKRLKQFYKEAKGLRNLKVFDGGGRLWDPSKIIVYGGQCLGGPALGQRLREQYHLEVEMCAPEYVIAMTSVMDTDEGVSRLLAALREIDEELESGLTERHADSLWEAGENKKIAETVLPPAKALEAFSLRLPLKAAAGRISREFVFLYPPGIPVLVPGERITGEILSRVMDYIERGLSVQGFSDSGGGTILCCGEASARE